MIDDFEPPTGNLPAVVEPLLAVPTREEAMLNALSPDELVRVARRMLDLVDDSKSDPARVSAAKLVLDRFAPKEDVEQKRREAEERHDAIAEARCLLAEFELAKSAGLYEPAALDQGGAPEPADSATDA